jgi:urea transport system permease protein
MRLIISLLGWLATGLCGSVWALDAKLVGELTAEDNDAKIAAIAKLAGSGDAAAIGVLQALNDGELYISEGRLLIVRGDTALDAVTGKSVTPVPENPENLMVNNRVRRELGSALASLKLSAPDRRLRLTAAREMQASADEASLPAIKRALEKEQDAEVKDILLLTQATIDLKNGDAQTRLAAVKTLAKSSSPSVRTVLNAMLDKNSGGAFAEPDPKVRAEAASSLKEIERRLQRLQWLAHAFSGLSLGSVLLLAALGLAITFGLMGIINMAHGEMLMIGAYATHVMQTIFRNHFPNALDYYLVAALPFAFLIAGVVGVALERGVIRFLYGRPLETLLCTWGVSLILIQAVRGIFGAQNVEVANPSWMSGGVSLASGLVLPYNRIAIIAFAAIVVLLMWLLLNKTRLGLFVRAVTQNRTMADCTGVATARVDMWTFGLGSGIAGLGGCALSQIGNVGPELGQSYIVDSFMVVVLGGVGQLAGTVIAALGLGEINKILEPYAGAVLGKIFVLVLIIIFIQKRPQGLFAIKGRSVEAAA